MGRSCCVPGSGRAVRVTSACFFLVRTDAGPRLRRRTARRGLASGCLGPGVTLAGTLCACSGMQGARECLRTCRFIGSASMLKDPRGTVSLQVLEVLPKARKEFPKGRRSSEIIDHRHILDVLHGRAAALARVCMASRASLLPFPTRRRCQRYLSIAGHDIEGACWRNGARSKLSSEGPRMQVLVPAPVLEVH